MQGADRYSRLFENEQHGRLYTLSGSHARGDTFHLFVLPEGVVVGDRGVYAKEFYAVEVYGITGGNPGWTETYGWLHEGPWIEDFNKIVIEREKKIEEQKIKQEAEGKKNEEQKKSRQNNLLANY